MGKKFLTFILLIALSLVLFSCQLRFRHTHNLTKVQGIPATCEESGTNTYWFCYGCGLYFSDDKAMHRISEQEAKAKVPALGHNYSDEWKYDANGHFHVCLNDNSHIKDMTPHTFGDGLITKPATQSEEGIREFTCNVCGFVKSEAIPKVAPSHEHAYEFVEFVWSQDFSKCQAKFVCNADGATRLQDLEVTKVVKQAQTCDKAEICVFSVAFEGHTDSKEIQTKEALGHKWLANPVFEWAEDYSSATATIVCQNDSAHNITLNATVTSEVTKEATELEKGEKTVTAVVQYDGKEYSDVQVIELPKIEHIHDYVASWSWEEDFSAATLTLTCSKNSAHVVVLEGDDVVVTSKLEENKIIYTATASYLGQDYSDTKEVQHEHNFVPNGYTVDGDNVIKHLICEADQVEDQEIIPIISASEVTENSGFVAVRGTVKYVTANGDAYLVREDGSTLQLYKTEEHPTFEVESGDLVIVVGTAKKFNTQLELDSGNIIIFVNSQEYELNNVVTEHASVVGLPNSAKSGMNVTFTIELENGYKLLSVELNGKGLVANEQGVYSFVVGYENNLVVKAVEEGAVIALEDVLTNANTIGQTTSSYADWTTSGMKVVYVGQSAGSKGTIQMRTNNNNSGIVATTSVGRVAQVVVVFNADTADARVLSIYGSNEAYTNPTDLYDSNKQGTLLGEMAMNNQDSWTLVIEGDYEYIGIRSKSGALYLDSITITYGDAPAPHEHSYTEVAEVAATCEEDGMSAHFECECGKLFIFEDDEYVEVSADDLVILAHHTLEHVEAKAATEEAAGNIEYWQCSVCHKYFSDEDGEDEITEAQTVIPALSHTHQYTEVQEVPATCTEDGVRAHFTCTCGKLFILENEQYKEVNENDLVILAHHTLEHVEAKAATLEAAGNIEYWHCSACDKYFSDAEATQEITQEQTIIPQLIPEEDGDYALITSNTQLADGVKVILGYNGDVKFAGTEFYNGQTPYLQVDQAAEFGNGKLVAKDTYMVFTLVAHGDNWYIQIAEGSYLGWESGNSLKALEEGFEWKISISENGDAIISNSDDSRFIRVNTNNPRFAAYGASSSVQTPVQLYLVGQVAPHEHSYTLVPEVAETCTENGMSAHFECECGKLFVFEDDQYVEVSADDLVILAHHMLDHVVAKAATEQEAGNIEYWHCTVCDKYFSDENAQNEIAQAQTVIPALSHTHQYTEVQEVPATCTENGVAAHFTCTCGKLFILDNEEYKEVNAADLVILAHHTLEHVEAKAATLEAAGNIEYWHCSACDKYFSDADATQEITQAETIIPQLEPVDDTVDVLTWELLELAATNNNYNDFSGKEDKTGAVYAGQASSGTGQYIQMRTKNNNSSIFVTTSAGKVVFVKINFNSTTTDRGVEIYGKNTPYAASTDVYDANLRGTLVATIMANDATTKFEFTDEYQYIAIKSKDGAIYIDSIEIKWAEAAPHEHSYTLVPEVAATCTEDGMSAHFECECGKLFVFEDDQYVEVSADDLVILAHHMLDHVAAKAATEQEAGNIEYWHCTVCDKYFSDENAQNEITQAQTVIPALSHTHQYSEVQEVPATCTENGVAAHFTCTCGKLFILENEEYKEVSAADLVILAHHTLEHVEAKEATLEAAGNIEYWHCTACNKYFSDAEATQEITQEQTIIPQLVPVEGDTYILLTDLDKLVDGARILIVGLGGDEKYYAMSTNQKSNNRGVAEVNLVNGNIVIDNNSEAQVITVVKSGNNWLLKVGEDSYLYAAGGSSSNYLRTASLDTVGDKGVFSLEFVENNQLKVVAQDSGTARNVLKYNYTVNNDSTITNLFACYAATNTKQFYVYFYVLESDLVPDQPHEHEYTLVPEVAATCLEPGTKAHYTCSGCTKLFVLEDNEYKEASVESLVIEALGHNYEAVITAPTCEAQGYTTHTCSRCQDSYVDTYVDALGHNYEAVFTWVQDEQTKAWSATVVLTCTRDNTHIIEDNATVTSEITVQPTEQNVGEETYSAKYVLGETTFNAPDTRTRELAKLDHTHQYTLVPEVPATCTETGTKAHYTCSGCALLFVLEDEKYNVVTADSLVIAALGHDYEAAFTWNGFEATVVLTCQNNQEHKVENLEVSVTSEVTLEPTDLAEGLRVYTASVTYENKQYSDTKDEVLAKINGINNPYTVAEAIAIAEALESNTYTETKVFVKGFVSEIGSKGNYYSSVYLKDSKDDEASILVYSINLNDVVASFSQNDTIIVNGYITKYGQTLEISSKGNDYAYAAARTVGTSTISVDPNLDTEKVSVVLDQTSGLNDSEFTFTVSVLDDNYEIKSVKYNTTAAELVGEKYTGILDGDAVVKVELKEKGAQEDAEVTFVAGTDTGSNGAAGNSDSVTKGVVTINGTNLATTTAEYRIYQNCELVISVTNGTIKKIEFECTASGTSKYGPGSFNNLEGYSYSGKIGTWVGSASSVTFVAGAQVRATTITVTYELGQVTPAAKHTVTLNVNGGNALDSNTLEVTEGGKYGELPTPTREGYTFLGWFTALENGTQITADSDVEITEDQELFALWQDNSIPTPTHKLTLTFNANEGSVVAQGITNLEEIEEGTVIVLTITPLEGKVIDTVTGAELVNDKYQLTMGEADMEVVVTFKDAPVQVLYNLFTANDLQNGAKVVIAYGNKVASGVSSKALQLINTEINGGKLVQVEGQLEVVLESADNGWYLKVGEQYINASSADLSLGAANTVWSISFDNDQLSVGYSTRALLYRVSSNIIKAYATSNASNADYEYVQLYLVEAGSAPQPHTHELTRVNTVAPTCTDAGHLAYWTCSGCDKVFSDDEGKHEISDLQAWLGENGAGYLAPNGHSWGEWVIVEDATCSEPGTKMRECANCDEDEEAEIPIDENAHNYQKSFVWNAEDDVVAKLVCSHNQEHVINIPVADVTITLVDSLDATCTDAGLAEFSASFTYNNVQYSDTHIFESAALGHVYEWQFEWADNFESAKFSIGCTRCQTIFVNKADADVTEKTENGIKTVTASYTYDNVTYTESKVLQLESESGVVIASNEGLPEGTTISASAVAEADVQTTANFSINGINNEFVAAYEISLINNNVAIQPNGNITIAIPYEASMGTDFVIYHIHTENNETTATPITNYIIQGEPFNQVWFTVDKLSQFVLVNEFTFEEFAATDSTCQVAGHEAYAKRSDGKLYKYVNNERVLIDSLDDIAKDLLPHNYQLVVNWDSLDKVNNKVNGVLTCLNESHTGEENVEATVTFVDDPAPTQTAEGKRIYSATYNNVVATTTHEEVLEKLTHDHDENTLVKTNEVAATCTEDGHLAYWTCSICSKVYADAAATLEITNLENWLAGDGKLAKGHLWSDWTQTTAPTCTEAGEEKRTCSRCNEFETRPVDALGHTPKDAAQENVVAATCTAAGSYDLVVRCDVCNEVISSEHKEVAALGHDWNAPTYAWNGDQCTATRTCKNGDHPETETVTGAYVKDTDATCSANEKGHYEASFENIAFEDQETDDDSVEKENTKLAPVFELVLTDSDNYDKSGEIAASLVCKNCVGEEEGHTIENLVATVEEDYDNSNPATYNAAGTLAFIASYTYQEQLYTKSFSIADARKMINITFRTQDHITLSASKTSFYNDEEITISFAVEEGYYFNPADYQIKFKIDENTDQVVPCNYNENSGLYELVLTSVEYDLKDVHVIMSDTFYGSVANPLTVEEASVIIDALANKAITPMPMVVKGIATDSTYDSTHTSYTIHFAVEENAKVFELYSVQLDEGITKDFTAANAFVDYELVVRGYGKKYDPKLEIAYDSKVGSPVVLSYVTPKYDITVNNFEGATLTYDVESLLAVEKETVVNFEIALNDGYKLVSVSANGDLLNPTLSEGKYQFAITVLGEINLVITVSNKLSVVFNLDAKVSKQLVDITEEELLELDENDVVKFKLIANEGYKVVNVLANNVAINPDSEGVYSLTITENVVVTCGSDYNTVHAGTFEDPLDEADVLLIYGTLANNAQTESKYYIKGTIIDNPTANYCNFNFTGNILTYGLSQDAEFTQRYGTSREISELPVQKDDVVILHAYIQNYYKNSSNTCELQKAQLIKAFYAVSVADGLENGNVTVSSNLVEKGQAAEVVVTITPAEGYELNKFYVNNQLQEINLDSENKATLQLTNSVVLSATFKVIKTVATVTFNSENPDYVEFDGIAAQDYQLGTIVEFTVSSTNQIYAIEEVYAGETKLELNNNSKYELTLNEDVEIRVVVKDKCLQGVPASSSYVLVTNASTLVAGDKIVLVANSGESYYVAGNISNSIMASVEVTVSNNSIATLPSGAVELTLGGTAGAWTLANSSNQLLGATAAKKVAWGSGTTTWSISITNNSATIQNGTSSYGRFLYNVNSPRFAPYTSDTTVSMLLPNIYKLVETQASEQLVHTNGEPVNENVVAATCVVDGSHDEVIYCTVCGREVSRTTVVDEALGHDYTEFVKFVWADDNKSAQAELKCSRCDATNLVAATMTSEVTQQATCTLAELSKFTATYDNETESKENVQTKAALGHDLTHHDAVAATCTVDGNVEYYSCSRCQKNFKLENNEYVELETVVVAASGHTYGDLNAEDPTTCTGEGLAAYYECSVCHQLFNAQKEEVELEDLVIPATGHTYGDLNAEDPATCTEDGLAAYYECSVCHKLFNAQKEPVELEDLVIPATGHTEVVDAAVAATCTETGLTEGKHCSVCNAILVAQQVIPATGHTEVIDAAVAATCTETGLSEGKHCSVCNAILVTQQVIPATGHTEVIDQAVAPTCEATGLTEGKHCSVCNAILVAQEVVAATGHSWVSSQTYELVNNVWVENFVCQNDSSHTKQEALQDQNSILASIGTAGYLSYEAAIEASEDGDTVKIEYFVNDGSLLTNELIISNKELTLDLNGKSLVSNVVGKSKNNPKFAIRLSNGTYTITNGSIQATNARGAIMLVDDAVVTLDGLTLQSNFTVMVGNETGTGHNTLVVQNTTINAAENAIGIKGKNNTVTITSGTFTSADNAVVAGNGISGYNNNTININGGTFNGNITSAGYIACGVYVANGDIVNVNGGTFNIEDGVGILARAGDTTVEQDVTINITHKEGRTLTEGMIGDSLVDISQPHQLVVDLLSNYQGGTPTLTNNTSYPVYVLREVEAEEGSSDEVSVQAESNELPANAKVVANEIQDTAQHDSVAYNNVISVVNETVTESETYAVYEITLSGVNETVEGKFTVTLDLSDLSDEEFNKINKVIHIHTENNVDEVYEITALDKDSTHKTITFVVNKFSKFAVIHEHNYGAWTVTLEPTCTATGSKQRTCSSCNEVEIEEINALGHDLVHHDAQAATCTEIGWNAYDTCARCDYTTYEAIPATGHTAAEKVNENVVNPTCTETGSHDEVVYCSVCSAEISREAKVDAALGHNYQAVVTAPTCTEAGYTTHTCSRCQDSYTDTPVAALGHQYGEPTWAWTGLASAKVTFTCERNCGHSEVLDAVITNEVTTEATAISEGVRTYTAKVTFSNVEYTDTKEETIPSLDHDYQYNWQYTETNGVWSAKLIITDANDSTCHEEVDGTKSLVSTTAATCTENGKNVYQFSAKGTVGETQTSENKEEVINALGHNLENHDAKAATCTEDGWEAYQACTRCDYTTKVTIKATGHTVVVDEAVAPTCTETGLTEGSHCSVCNEVLVAQEVVAATGHTEVVDPAVAATCTETGLSEGKHCSVCNAILVAQQVIPANGHSFGDWTQTVAPTCTAKGTERRDCANCDAYETREVEMIAHNYSDAWTIDLEATTSEDGSKSHHCLSCGAIDPTSVTVIPQYTGARYSLVVNNGLVELTTSDNIQYIVKRLDLAVNDTLRAYDKASDTYFNPYMEENTEHGTTKIVNNNGVVVNEAGNFDIYLKPEYNNDRFYIEDHKLFSVSGTFNNWSATDDVVDMTFNKTTGVYEAYVVFDKTLDSFKFKVIVNHSWDEAYPSEDYVLSSYGKYLITLNEDWYNGVDVSEITYEIRFVDENTNLLESKTVKHGQKPIYTGNTVFATEQNVYTITGWDKTIVDATEDTTYVAVYSVSTRQYTITFVNGDVVLQSGLVDYGETPSYGGNAPTKAATAQYTYTFTGWNPSIVAVTEDATYAAQFSSTVNEYDITWIDGNGDTLKTDKVAYGETPEYSGETPTKTATAQYSYTFNNTWSPAIVSVTEDATYTAQFNSTVNKYSVTFVDEDGTTVLKAATEYDYGTLAENIVKPADPTKDADNYYTYAFNGWTPTIANVTADATYTATYSETQRLYTIKFFNFDYGENKYQRNETYQLAYGETPAYKDGTNPYSSSTLQYTYTFVGWSTVENDADSIVSELPTVSGDANYYAIYTPVLRTIDVEFYRSYDLKYNNEISNVLQGLGTNAIQYGSLVVYNGELANISSETIWGEHFNGTANIPDDVPECVAVFDHWNPVLKELTTTEDLSHTAIYKVYYKVPAQAATCTEPGNIEHYVDNDGNTYVLNSQNEFVAESNVVIAASHFEEAQSFVQAMSMAALSDGATIQIRDVSGEYTFGEQKSNNVGVAASLDDGISITLEHIEDNIYALKYNDGNNDMYFYAASSGSNYLKSEETLDANGHWLISINNGVASIVAQGSNTRNVMQYNSGSSLFSCYGSASQTNVAIYVLTSSQQLISSVTHVAAQSATCTNPGNIEYWYCSQCEKYYSDSQLTLEVESVVTNATGHDFANQTPSFSWANDYSYVDVTIHCNNENDNVVFRLTDEDSDYGKITVDNNVFTATFKYNNVTLGTSVVDTNHTHSLTLHEAVPATCSTAGSSAYYECTGENGCGKYFEDSEGQIEILDKTSVNIAALGHPYEPQGYEHIENVNQLTEGTIIQIRSTNGENPIYMGYYNGTANNIAGKSSALEAAEIIVRVQQDDTIALEMDGKYLFAAGANSSNYLKTQPSIDNNAKWTVTIINSETGECSIIAESGGTRNDMRYNPNNGSPVFSCYASSNTTQTHVFIYVLKVDKNMTKTAANAATCTASGNVEYYTCKTCGHTFIVENNQYVESNNLTISALGHNYGEWTTTLEPTCTTAGSKERVCSRDSSHKEVEEIAALGHVLENHPAVAATETEPGNYEYWQCTRCSKYFSDANGTTETTKQAVTIPATGGSSTPQYTVSFNLNYTDATGAPASQTIDEGDLVTKPTDPTRGTDDTYTFGGWWTKDTNNVYTEWNFNNDTVDDDVELFARWIVTDIYTFTNKDFGDSSSSWNSISSGSSFESANSARGVQASSSNNLSTATKNSVSNVINVKVVCSSNNSSDLKITIGTSNDTKAIGKNNNKELSFDFACVSGTVQVETVNNTKSVWIKSVSITHYEK